MEATVKSPRTIKSAPVTKLYPVAKTEEVPQIIETPVKDEAIILAEIDEAESTLQLKQIAQKYPLFSKLVPDLKNIKAFNNLYEQMLDYLEPKIVKAKKAKAPKPVVASAYGVSIEIMCKDPNLSFQDLKKLVNEKGFSKDSATRTAHVTVKKIYTLLKANGFVK
jgi:hypothetical protein